MILIEIKFSLTSQDSKIDNWKHLSDVHSLEFASHRYQIRSTLQSFHNCSSSGGMASTSRDRCLCRCTDKHSSMDHILWNYLCRQPLLRSPVFECESIWNFKEFSYRSYLGISRWLNSLVINYHNQNSTEEECKHVERHCIPIVSSIRPHAHRPQRHQHAVLEKHNDIENHHFLLVIDLLEIDVGENVDKSDESAQKHLLELWNLFTMERVLRRNEPEEHGNPVENWNGELMLVLRHISDKNQLILTNDKKNPLLINWSVCSQREHSRCHRAKSPEELKDDSEPC